MVRASSCFGICLLMRFSEISQVRRSRGLLNKQTGIKWKQSSRAFKFQLPQAFQFYHVFIYSSAIS